MDESSVNKRMQEVVDLVLTDIGAIRTGRATPAIISDLEVSVYNGQQRLQVNELGSITAQDANTIVMDPWDKSIIGEIKKGIESANVGLNPVIDGEIIRITIPPMTSEDRDSFLKLLSSKLESGKVMIRQVRGDFMKDIKRLFEDKELSEDEKFNTEKKLQEITDKFIEDIEKMGESKKEELLQL